MKLMIPQDTGATIDRALPLAPQVYDYLRKRIVDNSLRPGERISESALAETFAISRTPLRAALQQLANEGLVKTHPQVGSVVAGLDDAQLVEAVHIRAALETEVVRHLAEAGTDLGPLDAILAVQEKAAARDDYNTFFPLDEQFHAGLARLANMPTAWRLVHSIKGHVDRQRFTMMSGIPMRSQRAFEEHQKIIERIEARDPNGAARAMRAHVNSVLELSERKEQISPPISG